MTDRHRLLLRLRDDTRRRIHDLKRDGSARDPEFGDASGSEEPTVLLATHLKDLAEAVAFIELELARRRARKRFH
jgi:hypothetical protein